MRQVAGALLRLARAQARAVPQALRSPGVAIQSPHKQWTGSSCILPPRHESRLAPYSFYAANFSSAAANPQLNSKDSRSPPAAEDKSEPTTEDKTEPVSKKDEKKPEADAKAAAKDKKAGDGEKKEEKKTPETTEQKLIKEVNKLEALIREKDAIIEEKDEMLKDLKNNLLRSYADLENFRERSKREQENARKFSVQGFSKDLLDVADNLSRALTSVGQAKDAEEAKQILDTLLQGVQMTEKQLSQVLKKHGIERFDPTGQPFDPNVHLAVCEVTDPSKPAGTVASVFKVGYLLHERVLRPAEVAVVKAAEAAA